VRWIANGKTVVNNKGKPVKQYEPYWSATAHRFDAAEAQVEVGGATVTYYDAVGRVVRRDTPDGAFSRAEFSPWFARQYDANDTVLDSTWYADRSSPGALTAEPTDPDQRAAWLATVHSNTPAEAHTDSLGRTVISIVHNRVADPQGPLTLAGRQWRNEKYLSFTKLDAEGKALWVRDALGNLVMQYITPLKATRWADDPTEDLPVKAVTGYDIAGNLLFQHSMDGGDRYLLTDGVAQQMLSWDRNERKVGGNTASEGRRYVVTYDALHRPLSRTLALNGGAPLTLERLEYSNARNADGTANAQLAADKAANLLGQLVRQYDGSGLAATIRRDFRGNVLEAQRRLNNQPTQSLISWSGDPQALLSAETFQQLGEFDALSRPVRSYNWRRINLTRVAVVESKYNQRGFLSSQQLLVRAQKTAAGYAVVAETVTTNAIRDIHYDLRGQMQYVSLGNGTLTQYDYDPTTFRLTQMRTTRPSNAGNFPTARAMLSEPGVVQQLLYSYDAVGNITEINDQAFEPVFFQNQQVSARARYEYDALYRLTLGSGRENGALRGAPVNLDGAAVSPGFPVSASDPNALRNYTQIFTYDAGVNIRELQHQAGSLGSWTRDYAYALDDATQAASNRLWQTWTSGDKTTAITYSHDTHGNLLRLANTAPNFNMVWDPADMIAGLDLGGGGQAYYQYAASKQRSRKQIVRNGGSIEERIYLDGFELFRRTSAGQTVEEIESHHLMLGDKRVLLVDDVLTAADAKHPRSDGLTVKAQTLLRYQYSNHLDSAGLELDGNAAIISYEEFHPYGTSAYRAVDSALEAAPKRYRFTGMERDEESGLGYHGARYCSYGLARWISPDPSGIRDGANRFAYVGCDPVGYRDSTGNAKVKWGYVAAGLGIAALGVGLAVLTGGIAAPILVGAIGSEGVTALAGGMAVFGAVSTGNELQEVLSEREGGYGRPLTDEEYSMKLGALPVNILATFLGVKGFSPGGMTGSGGAQALIGVRGNLALSSAALGPAVSSPLMNLEARSASHSNSSSSSAPGTDPQGTQGTSTKPVKKDLTKTQEELREILEKYPDLQKDLNEKPDFQKLVKKYPDLAKLVRLVKELAEIHHIASDKDQEFLSKFEELFEGAKMSLQDEENLVSVEGHSGPHGKAYNQLILSRLSNAVKGLKAGTAEYAAKFRQELATLKKEVATPGSDLNDLVTKPH
jgi:RHS repeat-associated protein